MPQFLVPGPFKEGERVELPREEAHHLRDVLRMKVGERILLFDGKGTSFWGEISSISKKEVLALVLEEKKQAPPRGVLHLGPALLKGEKMEFVVQKAVELGVDSLHPFLSSRTVVSWKKPEKLKRWQKIANEAAKQCGRSSLMTISAPAPFVRILSQEADLKIVFWEEGGKGVREYFAAVSRKETSAMLALVGPEGGFSREEIDLANRAGFTPVTLGSRILRAETAAIAAITLIQYELGNLG